MRNVKTHKLLNPYWIMTNWFGNPVFSYQVLLLGWIVPHFLYWLGGLWLLLLRIERQFSSSGRYLTECFKIGFYHPFPELIFYVTPVQRVMVPSTFLCLEKYTKYLKLFPSSSIYYFVLNIYEESTCFKIMTLVAISSFNS